MKLGKILAITCPIAAMPAAVLPLASCSIQKDHSDEIIVFDNNEQEITIQLTKDSTNEVRVPFKIKQEGATQLNFTLKWYVIKGDATQFTVDIEETVQGHNLLIVLDKTKIGEGNGRFEIHGTFTNKYGQKAESTALCHYTIDIKA